MSMRDRESVQDLMKSFRVARSQSLETYIPKKEDKPKRGKSNSSSFYQAFLGKYYNLEENLDMLGTRDLMYFFREKANENDCKYVIANMKRDMGIFKKLKENYSNREICLMIEFIFESDQDYLTKETIQPTVLISTMCNRIYNDSMLWVDDKYTPGSSYKSKKRNMQREWQGGKDIEDTSIGSWS